MTMNDSLLTQLVQNLMIFLAFGNTFAMSQIIDTLWPNAKIDSYFNIGSSMLRK